jgi:hypothetical protein
MIHGMEKIKKQLSVVAKTTYYKELLTLLFFCILQYTYFVGDNLPLQSAT